MEKPQVTRHWKDIHLRKDSADSLNDSIHSNRSSISAYKRFNCKRPEEQPKKSAVFHFTPRNKDKPNDISVLVKNSQATGNNGSKDISVAPRMNSLEKMVRRINSIIVDRDKIGDLNSIVKEVKSVISSLTRTFEYLQKQIKDLQFDWNIAMKQIAARQLDFENREIRQLKMMLEEKEQEIRRISQESNGTTTIKTKNSLAQAHAQNDIVEPPLSNLAVSAVDMTRPNEQRFLSRNNTLSSLLAGESIVGNHSFYSERSKKELTLLRQTMKKMKDMLSGGYTNK